MYQELRLCAKRSAIFAMTLYLLEDQLPRSMQGWNPFVSRRYIVPFTEMEKRKRLFNFLSESFEIRLQLWARDKAAIRESRFIDPLTEKVH